MKPLHLPLAIALASIAAPTQAATPFDETRPLNADAEVALDNLKGRIEVTTWDRNEIRIAGERGDGTKALLIEGDAAKLRVKIEYPESKGWFGTWNSEGDASQLRVTLPVGASLSVDSVSAEVDVRGVAGRRLSIENVSGDVLVLSAAREVEIETVSGEVSAELGGDEVEVESVSGDVEVRGDLRGKVSLEAVSGGVQLDSGGAARQISAGVVSGDVRLRTALQADGRLSAESLSGDLEVILPKSTSAVVRASSFSGDIRSDQGTVDKEEYGPGSSLSVTLASGAGRIDLETFSGDLRLRLE